MTGAATETRCKAEQCSRGVSARGMCKLHYSRWRRDNQPDCRRGDCDKTAHSRGLCYYHYRRMRDAERGEPCTVESCDRHASMTGLCTGHYSRKWYRENVGPGVRDMEDPIGAGPQTYNSMHWSLRRNRGSASEHVCIDCGNQAHHWSYNHSSRNELIDEQSGLAYSPSYDDYDPRCVSCHNRFDAEASA